MGGDTADLQCWCRRWDEQALAKKLADLKELGHKLSQSEHFLLIAKQTRMNLRKHCGFKRCPCASDYKNPVPIRVEQAKLVPTTNEDRQQQGYV
jgi:hypothetical protein